LAHVRARAEKVIQENDMSKSGARWRQRESEGLSRRELAVARGQNQAKRDVPGYPSTPGWAEVLAQAPTSAVWQVEEKLDGANCAIWFEDGRAQARDRTRALRKGVDAGGWGKRQFVPLWERAERERKAMARIEARLGFHVAAYGELLMVAHGRLYQGVPDIWRPWGLWSIEDGSMVDPQRAREEMLSEGWFVPALLGSWRASDGLEAARSFAVGDSDMGGPREGCVFKRGNGAWQEQVCKAIDPDFVQGALWSSKDPVLQNRR
jgi:hypothetical protein